MDNNENKDGEKKKKNSTAEDNRNLNQRMSGKFKIVTVIFIAAMLLVACRLLWIFVFDGETYAKAALNQSTTSTKTIPAKRGDILDRNGVQLATSARVYNLILDSKVILSDDNKYLDTTVAAVESCFGISATELKEKINENPDSQYKVLKKGLTYSDVEQFLTMKEDNSLINGVWLEDDFERTYVYSTLASSVLGFTSNGTGQYGIEYSYDDELSGEDGVQYTYLDSDNTLVTKKKEARDGYNVVSTIDYNIQAIVKKYVDEYQEKTDADTVAVIIQNPNTGEIYAMEDSGSFDPNSPRDLSVAYTQQEISAMDDKETVEALTKLWKNFCITESYEPGSTFKPFTLSAALSTNTTKMTDTFNCEGSLTFYDTDTIHCHDLNGHGTLDTKGAIAQSCNVALMEMAQKVGVEEFCKMQSNFGFGRSTGIDLPNEMSNHGLLYTKDNMGLVDLVTNSFGQNFNVTMIQMSTAFGSLINGGSYYKPYIVKDIYTQSGELVKANEKTLVATTVSEDICDLVKECLREVVVNGTAPAAAVPGYKIAGKTGTAEISGSDTTDETETGNTEETADNEDEEGYSKLEDTYVVSFLGFAPYDNPEVVCYVVLNRPNTGEDSSVACELFSKIMSEVLPYLNITPDDPASLTTTDTTDENSEDADTVDENAGDEENGDDNEDAYVEENYNEEEYVEEETYEEDTDY